MAGKKDWFDSVTETVDKATKAVAEAWDGTADVRKDAWEKTKQAVNTASDALDEGVEKVKAAYRDGANDGPPEDGPGGTPSDGHHGTSPPDPAASEDGTDEGEPVGDDWDAGDVVEPS